MKQLRQKLYEKFGRFTKDYFGSLRVNPTLQKITSIENRATKPQRQLEASRRVHSSDRPKLNKYLKRSVGRVTADQGFGGSGGARGGAAAAVRSEHERGALLVDVDAQRPESAQNVD